MSAPQSNVDRTMGEFVALLVPATAGLGLGMAAWDGLARIFGYF